MSWFFAQKFGMELEKEADRWKERNKAMDNINKILKKTLENLRK